MGRLWTTLNRKDITSLVCSHEIASTHGGDQWGQCARLEDTARLGPTTLPLRICADFLCVLSAIFKASLPLQDEFIKK